MRAYARQHLPAGHLARLHRAHARFYAAFAERAGPELAGPAQLDWQRRIGAERDNLHAAVTWALARGGPAPRLAFRIVTALLGLTQVSPVITRGWAESCLIRLGACPPELRAPVLTAAARNAYLADDFPLAQRRAEQVLAEPAPSDPLTSLRVQTLLTPIYTYAGQPERAIGILREIRQEAAERGIEVFVGLSLGLEAIWTRTGGYAAARQPAMEALEIARRVRNPALSAVASCAAAEAIWASEPQAALLLIEDSLALTRAGAYDIFLGNALTLAGVIRARNGDLPGALAALQEATLQEHSNGTRLYLGETLRVAAGMLARLGQAEPAVVLSGAFTAHFPGGGSAVSIPAMYENEQMATGKTLALARHALGEAAYTAALSRGAAMNDDEVVGYAVGEFQRVAALLAQPGARTPHAPPGPSVQAAPNDHGSAPPGMTPAEEVFGASAAALRTTGQ